jgi:signal transduction histidine kinase
VGTVVSDADKLRRIVANLVENAAKYAPEGPIDVDVTRADGALHLTVADRGPGVPAEDRERVFERFVQLDQSSTRRNGGTGLGLYLCRKLAGALGGSLTVEEAAGGGACFRLTLPTEEPAASLGNAAGSPAPAVAASPAQRAAQAPPPIEDATAPAASDAVSDYVAGGVA